MSKNKAKKATKVDRVDTVDNMDTGGTAVAEAPAPVKAERPRPGVLKEIERAKIMPSPTNPRKHFDPEKLKELAESIRRLGIQQPLIVRPLPKYRLHEPDMVDKIWKVIREDGHVEFEGIGESAVFDENCARQIFEEKTRHEFELVAGERRWRASELAELTFVPALVSVLTDQEALEIQYVENLQRDDLSALEEAEGFKKLIDSGMYTPTTLAAKLGVSKSHISSRVRLTLVCPEVRKAVEEKKLDPSIASLLAQIPDPEKQKEALEQATGGEWGGTPMTWREVDEMISDEYSVTLRSCGFDTKDAELLPKAGACATCPKRAANMSLFEDIGGDPNKCTDPKCFKLKLAAHLDQQVEAVKAKGHTVITGNESKALFDWQGNLWADSGYVKKTDVCPQDKKERTYEEVFKGKLPGAAFAVRDGKLVEIYKLEALKEQTKELKLQVDIKVPEPKKETSSSRHSWQEEEEKRKKKKLQREPIAKAAVARVLEIERSRKTATIEFWRRLVLDDSNAYRMREALKIQSDKAFNEHVNKMSELDCRLWLLQTQSLRHGVDYNGDWTEGFVEVCAEYGVDVKELEKEAKEQEKQAEKEKAKGGPSAGTKKAKGKKIGGGDDE